MKNKLVIYLGIIIFIFINIIFISSSEIRNIEYSLNLSYVPYCVNNICSNQTISNFNNVTNITTNYTKETCSSVCYGKLIINGVDNNQLFFEIDTGANEWKNGTTQLRYGYKSADLGNLSDISGIRTELQNLTTCFTTSLLCTANLTECKVQESNCQTSLSDKNAITQELNDWKNTKKWYFALGGIIVMGLFMWKGLPAIQGRKNPRDPSEAFPSNVPYK